MEIHLKKTARYQFEYKILRDDMPEELISLDTKTYLIHDITHYVVEKNLGYAKGFWGMLSQGYSFNQLFGKENPLTTELQFIEKIVGPVQSVYIGYLDKEQFQIAISHLNFEFDEALLDKCVEEIKRIMRDWEKLRVGGALKLKWV